MKPLAKTYKERYLKIIKDVPKKGASTQEDKLDKLFEEMNHDLYLKQRDLDTLKLELASIIGDPIIAPLILYRDKIRMLESKVDELSRELRHLDDRVDEYH